MRKPTPTRLPELSAELEKARQAIASVVDGVRDYAIFLLDPSGHVISWNTGAARIKGYGIDEIVGRHFSIFYTPEALMRALPERELEIAQKEGRVEDEGWRLRRDGTRFWANVVITPVLGDQGKLIGFLKITRDLSERRQHEDALRRSEERFRLLIEGVRDYAIFMLDPTGHITSWNTGAANIKGYTAAEVIGKHFSIFYPPELLTTNWPQRELEIATEDGRFEEENWRVRKDGSRFWANVILTALRDDEGRLLGFAKVTRDMTARRRIESLEEESRQTGEFLAMLGHELRNPLAPIRNAIEIMRREQIEAPNLVWSRDLIDRQVSQLSRIVDDLLDVSRVTSGRIDLQLEPLDLGEIVRAGVETVAPSAAVKGQRLDVALPDRPVEVDGDAVRLTQVVVNLLHNAVKYTPEGGRIDVSLDRDGYARLRVRDNGIGMGPGLVPRVFDLFVQGDRGLDRSEGGLGVGLTLVQRIVRMHSGTIDARSEGPDRGSEFVVRLPLRAAPAKAPEARPAAGAAARGRKSPLRILVVDDNRDSAESLVLLLRLAGHDVEVAYDGADALAAVGARAPDVAILDIGLPGMDGYAVAERMHAMPALAGTTLFAMTGYGTQEDRERSRKAGFMAHLVKPVDPDRLEALLADVPRKVERRES